MSDFDAIFKENFESILVSIGQPLLGINLKNAKLKPLKTELTQTHIRAPDFLKHVKLPTGDAFILHVEFQSTNEPHMEYRMAEYKALLLRQYKMPIKQFVLYIGRKPAEMKTQLPPSQHITGYELLDANKWKAEALLESDIPEEILLAILGNFDRRKAVSIIRRILSRLQQLQPESTLLQKYLKHLTTLARLRKLETQTKKEIQAMPIEYDITTDGFYLEGLEQGIEQGLERGLEQGKRQAVAGLLTSTNLSPEDIARALSVSLELVFKVKAELDS